MPPPSFPTATGRILPCEPQGGISRTSKPQHRLTHADGGGQRPVTSLADTPRFYSDRSSGVRHLFWRSALVAGRVWDGDASRVRFVIRDAVPTDMAVLQDVFRRSSLSNEGDRRNLLANPDALEFPGATAGDRRRRVATTADGHIVGFATALIAEDAIELDDLFVDPGWMGQGAGRALVADVIATARDQGAGRVEVTANPHALVFYEKVGFVFDCGVMTRFGPGLRLHLDVVP